MDKNLRKIGVQVVVNNKLELTKAFLDNFYKYFNEKENLEMLVVDNNSVDGTFNYIKKEYPQTNIVRLNDNYGTTTGRNVGIVLLAEAGCEFIYLSDNDVEFRDKNFFDKLISFSDKNKDIDAFCPVVKWYDDETIQTLGTREVRKNWFRNVNTVNLDSGINSLPGCAQFVRSSTFRKYGVYDNDLSPISIEDLEWGMRATRNGAKMSYVSFCEIYHMQKRNAVNSPQKMEHVLKGRGVFLRKYFNLQSLFRELKNFIYSTKNYGFMFSVSAYKKGFTRKLDRTNFAYAIFKKRISEYITEKHLTTL
jgi:GT2 family glycosyltransferase